MPNILKCKENCIQQELHFLIFCQGYTTIRRELHSHIVNAEARYSSLSDKERTKYLLRVDSKDESKVIGKYILLYFKKRKEILNSKK